MSQIEKACPFDAATRAARCASCSVANASLPPCVVAFLAPAELPATNVVTLRRPETRQLSRAA
jgi:hypothetical protein